MFWICLRRAAHVREYSVSAQRGDGWELKVEEDSALTRYVRYHDWHRVERTLALLRHEVTDLVTQGWTIQSSTTT
jgi:hypothetical protein